ncbi:unnamed protein product [Rotaria magnacalcarata]|uniref:Uncharacterized protein n=1 Tax=Rotaria magnacalcarata TaxID=392030 RepID=A0A819NQA6_9BILA|nr:unnamed protein product [Rotaria magnacalcarata]
METIGIIPINDRISEIPPWMICMYKKFSNPLITFNIKLFLMCLIIHTHTIFKPYACYWLTPIIHICNQMFENLSEAIPSELDSIAVQRLIKYLFSNCSHRNVIVMKSNLDLIKKLMKCWKESNDILPYYVSPTPTGNLSPITTNLILTTIPNDLTEDKFNDTILNNMKNTYKNIYAAAAEVIGMLLNVKKLKHETNQRLLEQLNLILKWHNSQDCSDTYVTCIYSIQKHYSLIVEINVRNVMNKLIFGLKKMYGDIKIECLESLNANITEFDSAYLELRAAGILDILIHKDFGIRGVALRLLHKLLPNLRHEQLYEIAQILYVDGPNECQIWTLEIYKWMYDYITNYLIKEIKTSITPLSEMFYHHVREQLLQLLSSKNEYIRVNCRNFLCDPKRLSTSSHHRLMALIDQLYSIRTENEYLNYCTNFLLERTTHNPDYNHFIFENPLDKCSFQEFPLACNWRQRHHTYMTPLFTLQSQSIIDPSISATTTNLMTMDPVQFKQTLSGNNNNNNNADQQQQQQQSSNSTSSMILQTQEISSRQQFVPTQMLDNNNNSSYNWLKQTNTLDSINTFMLPTLSTQTKKTTSLIVDVDNTNKKSKTNTQINI